MGKVMIINASPREAKSNSKKYAALFAKHCQWDTEYYPVSKSNHAELCRKMEQFSDVLFVFPLYVDSIPSPLLRFLKTLEENAPSHKPVISVLINCGFIEPEQNDVAVKTVRLFCRKNGVPFGSVLKIGSGEAILTTPLRIFISAKIKRFAASITTAKYKTMQSTMPISKKMFLKASSVYWENYGKKNGITKEQMMTMQIEGK